jgi:site-specific recombinase XerD
MTNSLQERKKDLPAVFEADVPAVIDEAGPEAKKRFLEFFLAQIRNENTRRAYGRAVDKFLVWCEQNGLSLPEISPIAVSSYVEQHEGAPATVKQHLAAIRRLFDWMQSGGVLEINPAEPVRGPKHVVEEGSTPILTAEEATEFIEGLPTTSVKDKRDKAIIGVLTYTFARVSALVNLDQEDYFQAGRRRKLRLKEKGGKRRDVPLHHKAKDYLEDYLEAGGRLEQRDAPLFRTMTRSGTLSDRRINRRSVLRVVKSRADEAGFDPDQVCCHTFRGTGITAYLENGGKLEVAQHIAGHSDPSTTRLYDRRKELVSKEEVEKIGI